VQYKILFTNAVAFIGTDFGSAAEHLADQVNQALAEGWRPQGGVAVGDTQNTKAPFLFQAMVKEA